MTLETVAAAGERLNAARAAERRAALELRDAIVLARANGLTLSQIAGVLGISRQRVMQLSQPATHR